MFKPALFYIEYLNLFFFTNFFCMNVIVQKTTSFLLVFSKGLKYADKNEWYTLV